jgi:hypothetical protein
MKLSEDWQATILGLVIVAIIGLGLLGPGPQNVVIKAAAGETKSAEIKEGVSYQISATVDGEKAVLPPASYSIICQDNQLTANDQQAGQFMVINNCDREVVLTMKSNPAIPWPVFNIFSR